MDALNHALRGIPEDRETYQHVHAQVMWATLHALAEGARIASQELWA